jgi:predicted nucleotidyltransferase
MDSPAGKLRRYFEESSIAGLVSAYLFGSVARGAAHRESDVDVGVLLDRSRYADRPSRTEARIRLTSALIHVLGQNAVDVVVLNDVPPELGRAVVTQGERVYCREPEADHAFVRDAQLRAADLQPFLRRMRRIKLEGLRS